MLEGSKSRSEQDPTTTACPSLLKTSRLPLSFLRGLRLLNENQDNLRRQHQPNWTIGAVSIQCPVSKRVTSSSFETHFETYFETSSPETPLYGKPESLP